MIYKDLFSSEELVALNNLKSELLLNASMEDTLIALMKVLSNCNRELVYNHSWFYGIGYFLLTRARLRKILPRRIMYPMTYYKNGGITGQFSIYKKMLKKQGYPKTREDIVYSVLGIDKKNPPKSLINTQLQLLPQFKHIRNLSIDKVLAYLDKVIEKGK